MISLSSHLSSLLFSHYSFLHQTHHPGMPPDKLCEATVSPKPWSANLDDLKSKLSEISLSLERKKLKDSVMSFKWHHSCEKCSQKCQLERMISERKSVIWRTNNTRTLQDLSRGTTNFVMSKVSGNCSKEAAVLIDC